ncbi:amidase [Gayadomonas joobiniege]|uniref:amidase n=1 Tax=Gayadomonas joobiniege TaxID=1234606 RepID=UPI000379BCAC|nr:amidase family protein [Gayadomonas joobiniege]
MKKHLLSLTAVALLQACNSSDSDPAGETMNPEPIDISEITIAGIHSAIESGEATCESIIEQYVERNNALNKEGPALNAVITLNDKAIEQAIALDEAYAEEGLTGKMHCVPVTLKDNVNTKDLPTTGGAIAGAQPDYDAFITQRILAEGGIIISKANLHEYALGYGGGSTLGGQAKNVYDISKGPGGSSSGTATAVSANMAVVGIGTDTGGSIRVPSSVQGLVGIRPSMRLVSQNGIMPLAPFQDTAGPICRTVADCAVFLDVLTGYDEAKDSGQRQEFAKIAPLITNEAQYKAITNVPENGYKLDADALEGARIGVVRDMFAPGDTPEQLEVNRLMENAIENMKAMGAVIVEVDIPDLDYIVSRYYSLSRYEFETSLEDYLLSWPSDIDNHPTTMADLYNQGMYTDGLYFNSSYESRYLNLDDPWEEEEYLTVINERPDYVRSRITQTLDQTDELGNSLAEPLDVIIYPSILGLAGELGRSPTTSGTNNRLSPFSGYPAITLPVGYSDIEGTLPLPVGLEMLAREFDEATLIKLAHSYESHYSARIEPEFLSSETLSTSAKTISARSYVEYGLPEEN